MDIQYDNPADQYQPPPWQDDPMQSVPWAPDVAEAPPPAGWPFDGSDNDPNGPPQGFMPPYDGPEAPEPPWQNPTNGPLTRAVAESRGGWGGDADGSMTYTQFASPQGMNIPGAAGMDPQLRDLRDAGPTAYVQGMYPSVGPSFGQIQRTRPDQPDPFFTDPTYRGTLDQSVSQIPPSAVPPTPLDNTVLGPSALRGQGGASGMFYGNQIWGESPEPWILNHEYGHYIDSQNPQTGNLMAADPNALQNPRYQDWQGLYGDQYDQSIPKEVTAEEAMRAMNGMPPAVNPNAAQVIRQQLLGAPPSFQPGYNDTNNPYLPGSTQAANFDRYLQYRDQHDQRRFGASW